MKIWKERAEIQLPEGFEEATVGEKRKTYGMGKKLPDKMYIVRDKHVIISTFSQELKEQKESNIELVKALNYLYTITVPGYKNIGTYRKNIDGQEIYVIQYTSYAQEDDIYTIVAIWRTEEEIHLLSGVCRYEEIPQWHPIFRSVIEGIKIG